MKLFTILKSTCALLLFSYSTTTVAQYAEPYFQQDELPNLIKVLPTPPDTCSEAFSHDIMRYFWGKTMRRDPERAATAIRDADWRTPAICHEFSVPFGLAITPENTPEIFHLLDRSLSTSDHIATAPKAFYMRKRPFARFQEPSLAPWDDEELSHNGSYPSGHTIRGWCAALILSEINPAAADTLLARGYIYGESRVVVGAHWQSDVDAGYLAATAVYMKLHTSPDFLQQLERARAEFARLTRRKISAK